MDAALAQIGLDAQRPLPPLATAAHEGLGEAVVAQQPFADEVLDHGIENGLIGNALAPQLLLQLPDGVLAPGEQVERTPTRLERGVALEPIPTQASAASASAATFGVARTSSLARI